MWAWLAVRLLALLRVLPLRRTIPLLLLLLLLLWWLRAAGISWRLIAALRLIRASCQSLGATHDSECSIWNLPQNSGMLAPAVVHNQPPRSPACAHTLPSTAGAGGPLVADPLRMQDQTCVRHMHVFSSATRVDCMAAAAGLQDCADTHPGRSGSSAPCACI